VTRLAILEYPDPRLRTVARPVTAFDTALAALIDDLFETLYSARAIGLAATQVDVHQQVLVIDVSAQRNAPEVFINPRILARQHPGRVEESCLSVPGVLETVERATQVRVRAVGRAGRPFERELEGLEAVCLQHEMDHLAGKLFLDRLPFLARWRTRRRLAARASGVAHA